MIDHTISAALQLIPDPGSTSKLSQKTQDLLEYFSDGHRHYQETVSKDDRFDFQDSHEFVSELLKLSNNLTVNSGAIFLTLHKDDQQINVLPLVEFLKDHPAEECIQLINVINTALVQYVHPDNCVDFKSAFETLQKWKYVFMQLDQSK